MHISNLYIESNDTITVGFDVRGIELKDLIVFTTCKNCGNEIQGNTLTPTCEMCGEVFNREDV